MNKKILNTIEKHNMLNCKSVVVALSGGADSMVLLYFFHTHKELLGIKLKAVHLNHNIRGDEALRDQKFVEEYCKKIDVPLTVHSKDIPKIAKEKGESLEECGRRIRYELFHKADAKSMIATAHHLDDSAETALFNLVRGTGIRGMRGILPVRGRIIRPLIECNKTEILNYCKEHNIPYMTDSTNENTNFIRNKIRANIIPLLKDINPSFLDAFSRNSEILFEYEDFISDSANKLLEKAVLKKGYSVDLLLEAHPAIRKTALAKIAELVCKKTCEHRHIQALEQILKEGGKVTLPGNKQLWSNSKLLFEPNVNDFSIPKFDFCEIPLNNEDKSYQIFDKTVEIIKINEYIHNKSQKINNKVFIKLIDYDTISGNIVLRGRKSGDTVRLFARNCTKSLKKLFNEAKIPLFERDKLLILEDDAGIIWIEGFGASERCAVTSSTRQALKIEIQTKGRHENHDW